MDENYDIPKSMIIEDMLTKFNHYHQDLIREMVARDIHHGTIGNNRDAKNRIVQTMSENILMNSKGGHVGRFTIVTIPAFDDIRNDEVVEVGIIMRTSNVDVLDEYTTMTKVEDVNRLLVTIQAVIESRNVPDDKLNKIPGMLAGHLSLLKAAQIPVEVKVKYVQFDPLSDYLKAIVGHSKDLINVSVGLKNRIGDINLLLIGSIL